MVTPTYYLLHVAERVRLSTLRVDQGVAGQLELLDAQRSLFAARQDEVGTQLELVRNRVTLYRVLGGDQATTDTAQ